MHINKYIVSGIPESNSGVGRLMRILAPRARALGYLTIFKRENKSLRLMLERKYVFSMAKEIIARVIDAQIFFIRTLFIRKSVVLFVHPQTAGFDTLFRLIKKNNRVFLYVMDNSFFCLRSYNNSPVTHSECLVCVTGAKSAHIKCLPFHVNCKRDMYVEYIKELKCVSHKIFFLAQNKKQQELLELHFGNEVISKVVGLDTGDIKQYARVQSKTANDISYDLVFHGAPSLAKGAGYFVELAILLPEFSFFMPASKIAVEKVIEKEISVSNIVFEECDWDTGLKSAVLHARLVINPSLWSAPIEGALVKSLCYNKNVAVVESQYGYAQEIVNDCNVLSLPPNTKIAAQKIKVFLAKKDININNGDNVYWINAFVRNNNVDTVFSVIANNI